MANRIEPRQLVLLSFSRLRFFQNLSVFLGMSPWPVVDVTKMTSDARSTSAWLFGTMGLDYTQMQALGDPADARQEGGNNAPA